MTDLKIEEEAEALRAVLARAVHFVMSGVPAHQGLQAADRVLIELCQHFAGARVTFPAAPKYDGAAIAADWAAGLSLEEIMRKHDCSRSTAYGYHPNGKGKRAA